jgi:hypothetical protein
MTNDRPNIIVFGVGHSGTTILTRMLFRLGWSSGESLDAADAEFAEHIAIRDHNRHILQGNAMPAEAGDTLRALKAPWAIKDPRFVITLGDWLPLFVAEFQRLPALLWVVKEESRLRRSYETRGEFVRGMAGSHGHTVEELVQLATTHYDAWPGPKLRISYDDLADALALFKSPSGPSDVGTPAANNGQNGAATPERSRDHEVVKR